MKELQLKYGCNPNQKPAYIFMEDGSNLPLEVVNGKPGYINLLDALNGWQLVKELKEATGLASATSFKHVSPTSAAVGIPLEDHLKSACFVENVEGLDDSPIASAYARARGTDRMSSFGDFIALSDPCDITTAKLIKKEVSDGIIAPDYDQDALNLLKEKRKGNYTILKIDPNYEAPSMEKKMVFGITFAQAHNKVKIGYELFDEILTKNKEIPKEAKRDLLIALIALKYTQSNSVAYAYKGQTIGIGAGQQSRIHCTRLAGTKADTWFLRQAPQVLNLPWKKGVKRPDKDNAIDSYINKTERDVTKEGLWQNFFTEKPASFSEEDKRSYLDKITGVSLASDAFFPFGDNIERAHLSGVSYVAEPAGSIRDDHVIATADQFGMVLCKTGLRLFHH